jgi:hypothetical protein
MSILIRVDSSKCATDQESASLYCNKTAIWNVDACRVYLKENKTGWDQF